MGNGILGIGVSALNVAQAGMQTTAHNIANANTPGYTRQQVLSAARTAQFTGAGFMGQGADVGSVNRIYSEYLTSQVLTEQNQAASLNTYYSQIQQINNVIADQNAGVSPAIQDFFGAVNNVANSPESMPARQSMVNTGNALAARFQSLNQRLTDVSNSVGNQISNSVTLVNSYAKQISALNKNITTLQSTSNQPPNDLMDQRDLLVKQLNTEIKATTVKQADGSYNVFIGNGQSLVVGSTVSTLAMKQSPTDPSKQDIVYNNADGTQTTLQQSSLQGGNIGGLLTFRDTTLASSQNALGRVAMGIAGTLNQQSKLGQDLNGVLGGNFFSQPLPAVYSSTLNTGTAVVSAAVNTPADFAALTGSDYTLKFNGGTSYTLTRLSDNTQTVFATGLPATPVDGLTLTSTVGAVAGDTYSIRPTANGARDIAVSITDPAKIAAAVPIRTNAALTNVGNAVISSGTVDTTFTAATVATPVTLKYNLAANPAAVPPVTANTLTGFPALMPVTVTNNGVATVFAAGAPVTYTTGATISFGGASFTLSGTPAEGDTFAVTQNTNATTDNRNALIMAGLQTQNTLGATAGGKPTMTYQSAYAQWVSDVGNKTRELQVTSTAQTSMAAQSVATQQSYSGVNLDEEAANLMRYQRAYQAAGKAMQIANTMFDAILGLGK